MRQTRIFAGSSHPVLVDGICQRLGRAPDVAELRKFSNGETSVQIRTSVRDQDVFIVQSGSSKINDNVVELLIMISACKGGSARSITAVLPYFPYSRQSKKKYHRGAITARMIANLLDIAGVSHVITLDLHASQMQGFFKCPVDNLVAEPIIARWIRTNVKNWRDGVVVSKNPGGTKRVTSLADALKLSFGIVTTDRRRQPFRSELHSGAHSMNASIIFESLGLDGNYEPSGYDGQENDSDGRPIAPEPSAPHAEQAKPAILRGRARTTSNPFTRRFGNGTIETPSSPLAKSTRPDSPISIASQSPDRIATFGRASTEQSVGASSELGYDEEHTDERARDVVQGRLVQGHIVDEDEPSPSISAYGRHTKPPSDDDQPPEHMMASFMSTASSLRRYDLEHALGGSVDANASSEEEEEELKNPEFETTVTLVGNVRDRPVFIVDDMIDKAGSWIAAAETVVKRGGATEVYCMATHGLFGDSCLEDMESCEYIKQIIVTNSFPIPPGKAAQSKKLVVLNIEGLLAEAIRRNHHGESMSQLFMHYD